MSNNESTLFCFPAYWESEQNECLLLGDFFAAPSTGSNWQDKAMK